MSDNNLLDADTKRPLIFDDRLGKDVEGQRMDLETTLKFVSETFVMMTSMTSPKIQDYALHFATRAICRHMGWLPSEVAVAQQYMTMLGNESRAPDAVG